ncbi:MAG: murein hydrolase activator EnvC family protein [Ruminococcus sp.]
MSKKKHMGLRFTSAALCLSILAAGVAANWTPVKDIPVSAKTLAELQEERKSNEAKIAEKQKQLDSLQTNLKEKEAYQKTLQEKITLQQENLDIVSEELDRIAKSIDETTQQISQAEDDIKVMEADIAIGLDEFKMRLRAMYVQGNDSLASALVGATDFYDLLSKYELMSRVANHDNELVNDLKDKLETCNEKKAELETEKSDLESQQEDQQAKKEEFKAAIEDLQQTYSETDEAKEQMQRQKEQLNGDVATLEENNKALDAEEDQIKAAIAAAAEAEKKSGKKQLRQKKPRRNWKPRSNSSRRKPRRISPPAAALLRKMTIHLLRTARRTISSPAARTVLPATVPAFFSGSTVAPSGGGFTWPCPGFYTVSSTFGNRWGTTHGAIDIAGGNAGAAIVAAKSGTVVRVVTGCSHNYPKSGSCGCGGGYGNYVIIQHDGTYSTLYGHMASVSVSVGQSVSAGQTIGYVGSTGFSTGFHLHFEVRVNGTKVDPMKYL